MSRAFVSIFCPLGLLALPCHGQIDFQLPRDAQENLADALELTEFQYFERRDESWEFRHRSKVNRAAVAFAKALDGLGGQVEDLQRAGSALDDGRDISSKLVAIARDRKRRPELYDEIEKSYIVYSPGMDLGHSMKAPAVRDEHATEMYRLAWEFYLLTPEPDKGLVAYMSRARQALVKIGNDASIVTLVHVFRVGHKAELAGASARGMEQGALESLCWFRSERGLRALLDCVELHNRAVVRGDNVDANWDPDAFVAERLRRALRSEGSPWRQVIRDFPREDLPPDQRQLLSRLTQQE